MRSKNSGLGTGALAPLWWRNTFQAWELALAVPEVIAHRTARMARAGHFPSTRDRKEFTRMGQEKGEAFAESLIAMALPMYMLSQELALVGVRQWGQWWNAWAPLASITASSTPAALAKAQGTVIRGLASAAANQRLADSFARVVEKGLAPVRRTATRNAKRLRRVKLR
jgi:hypothetical protein